MDEDNDKSREDQSGTIKVDSVVATAHAQGLLITFSHGADEHMQALISKDLALALARDILNVMYNMGLKTD